MRLSIFHRCRADHLPELLGEIARAGEAAVQRNLRHSPVRRRQQLRRRKNPPALHVFNRAGMQIAPENPLAFPRADVRAGCDFAERCRLVDVRIHPREHLLEPLFSGIRTRTRRFQSAFLQHIQQDLRQRFPHAEFKPRFFLFTSIKGALKRTQARRVRPRQIQPKKGRSLLDQRANIFDIK